MTDEAIASAKADIESTADLLERALKLSGLITSLFAERGFKLVVVGGSTVEFYTEGGYMSGDIDFCRKTLNAIPPRVMQEIVAKLGLDAPSRRPFGHDDRLRAAFGGSRAPSFAS